ncbi:MAG: RnfABCDGE type electron transport complex subunit C, partial [Erysipelotrichaceae bacterium]
MSLLIGPMRVHLNGHKEETLHNEIMPIKPKKAVYIPLNNGTATTVDVLVNEGDKVKVGTLLAKRNDTMIVPIYSSVSGTVGKKVSMMHAGLKPQEHLVIEDDGRYESIQSFSPLDYTKASREALLDFLMNAGIVGCGGAGFPTYMKYRKPLGIHTLIINAVECEPYITADYRYTKENVQDMILGTRALLKLSTAKKAYIAIKKTKKEMCSQLKAILKNDPQLSVFETPDVYPMGWERTLVFELLKKRYDRLPSEVGVICNNVTTAIAFAQALQFGKPITDKVVTFSGDGLKYPTNISAPYGTKISEIIEEIGGYTCDDVLMIAGGPMMGKTIPNEDFVLTSYANAVIVLKNRNTDALPCLRCGSCNDTCPAGLLPVRINSADKAA